MSMKITPDIAELMGTYMEGGKLSTDELQLVHSSLEDLDLSSLSSEIDSLPNLNVDSLIQPVIGEELLSNAIAMDFMDDSNSLGHMNTHSIIGDVTPFPGSTGLDIIQQQDDTCAIKSQQIIMHSFGIDIPESSLTMEATTKGYYMPGHGSNADMVGLLLEDHGIDTHSKTHATVYDLAAELAQGHKVIVGVDADELWRPSFMNDIFGEQANHALLVTGIDTSNPYDVQVIVTDPGTGEVARSYPMDQFMDAWHDSACMMVATDEAPQVSYGGILTNPEMVNFDYAQGHIPYIGNIPYDTFADNMLPQFDDYFDHQFMDLHSDMDYQHMFDNMDHAYDHFDDQFAMNDIDDGDGIDVNGMFNMFF